MLFVGLLAAALASGPTYLHCDWKNGSGNGGGAAEFALDETSGRASLSGEGFPPASLRAIFTASDVTIPQGPIAWRISRVDLSIRRTYSFAPDSAGDAGTCKIVPAPAARAF
jgi:hypothetical protein